MKRIHKRMSLALLLTVVVLLTAGFTFPKWPVRRGQPAGDKGSCLILRLVKSFPFSEENCLKEWEEKVFKGKVVYKVESEPDKSFVRAKSDGTASALYYKVKMDSKRMHPAIRWKWRVEKFPDKKGKESLETENEDDFAARVFVIFPTSFMLNSRVLEYIWAENLPVGSVGTSPYSKNIKLIVLRSGPSGEAGWCPEDRDILADYNMAFKKPPDRNIGAIAFMTNTEHTGSSAEAIYDDIEIGYKEDAGATEGGSK